MSDKKNPNETKGKRIDWDTMYESAVDFYKE